MDQPMTNVDLRSDALTANTSRSRLRHLHGLGTQCGFAAGAWLGAADAPAGWEWTVVQYSCLPAKRFWLPLRPLSRMGEPTLESLDHWARVCSGGPCTSPIGRRTSQG